jgi:hypothetical protein
VENNGNNWTVKYMTGNVEEEYRRVEREGIEKEG